MVGFGEAPGTLWVWAPGLPEIPFGGPGVAVCVYTWPTRKDLGGLAALQTSRREGGRESTVNRTIIEELLWVNRH